MHPGIGSLAILADLDASRDELDACYRAETGYSAEDMDFLWRDMRGFFIGFADAVRVQQDLMASDIVRYQGLGVGARITYRPWGKVLITLPTNALIPLMPMIAASFAAMGNRVTVAVPGRLRATADLMSTILLRHLGDSFESPAGGIKTVLYDRIAGGVDFLYYIGGSVHKRDIVAACVASNIDFIFEGEGKSLAIVDGESEDFLRQAADTILATKRRCLGRLCTSCNTVLVSARSAAALIARLVEASPAQEVTGHDVMADASPAWAKTERPVGWATHAIETVPLNQDLFSSSFFLASFEDSTQLKTALRRYDGGIEVALFVERDTASYEEIVLDCTHVGRLTINRDPTVQSSLLPWGGYRSGGPSPVATFLEKAVRRVIVEG